jgi:hypothetical protein
MGNRPRHRTSHHSTGERHCIASATTRASCPVESRMRGNAQVRFGGRLRETDRRQRRHRALSRPYLVMPRVGVPELTLDYDERDALVRHLDRVGVAQLVRREPAPNASFGGRMMRLVCARPTLPIAGRRPGRGSRIAAHRSAVDGGSRAMGRAAPTPNGPCPPRGACHLSHTVRGRRRGIGPGRSLGERALR